MHHASERHDVRPLIWSSRPRPRLFVILGILFALITFAAFMDQGLTKRFVIVTIFLGTSLMLAIAMFLRMFLRPGYVEVSGDRLTIYNGWKRRTIRLSDVVGVGFGVFYVPPALRGLALDLMQRDVSYGWIPGYTIDRRFFPWRKDLGENGRDAKHFMINVTKLDKTFFQRVIPPLLNNPDVYVAPQARTVLERIISTGRVPTRRGWSPTVGPDS